MYSLLVFATVVGFVALSAYMRDGARRSQPLKDHIIGAIAFDLQLQNWQV